MKNSSLNIATLKLDQLPLLFQYAALENWIVEEEHLKCQFKNYAEDFFVAYLNSDIVGFVIALKQSENFGFISTLLVLKEFRSCGFGAKLLDHALKYLDGFQIALNSTQSSEKLYQRVGFKTYFQLTTYQYTVTRKIVKKSSLNSNSNYQISKTNNYLTCLVKNRSINYRSINHNSSAFAFSSIYADGYKITLNTQNLDELFTLFNDLTKEFSIGTKIYIETMPLNSTLLELVNQLNMSFYSEFNRMYNTTF
ncbi:MAG: GNAT family N-acetyltransferase [Helicobacteraceae bacterium]|nr:GNAT family N-acetyltransferase [Helicobacteraceae bacterium]